MRWLVRLVLLLISTVVVGVIGVSLVPAEKIAEIAAREVSKQTGRELRIIGGVNPVFFPVIGVKTGRVEFANAEWSRNGPLLEADQMIIGIELGPLLSGTIKIKEFRVDRPVIRLEKNRSGKANWDFATSTSGSEATEGSASSGVAGITLEDGKITDGQLSYRDAATGAEYLLENVDLSLSAPAFDGRGSVSGSVEYQKVPLSFSASLGRLDHFLDGAVTPLELSAKTASATVSLAGEGGFAPLQAKGSFQSEISDLPGLLRLFDASAGGIGRRASAKGDLTFTSDNQAFLRGAEFTLDTNVLQGDIDLNLADRPKLTARLDAGDLTLPIGASSDGGVTQTSDQNTWSKTPIDASGLKALDADVVFKARSLKAAGFTLGPSALRATLENGRLVINLNDVNAYGGKIGGEYVLNGRSGLSTGGTITATGIALQPLLVDAADIDRLIARGDLRVKFLASGNSVDALMKSLSGDGSFKVGGGELLGLDIAGMLRNLDASYRGSGQKTIFSEVTGSYTMKGGILHSDDLKFVSDHVDATGKGDVNIGARSVKYRLVPTAFTKKDLDSAGGISVPVLIEGPWNRISYKPDLQSLFDAELEKQREEAAAKLKGDVERAKTEAREKLQGDVDRAIEEGKQKLLDGLLEKLSGQD